MMLKQQLLLEIESTPAALIPDVLDYLRGLSTWIIYVHSTGHSVQRNRLKQRVSCSLLV